MKKILILTNNGAGLYKFRKELLESLIEQENEVYISLPDGNYSELLRQIGCIFSNTPIDKRGTNPIKDFMLILYYYRLIKKIKPDMVLTFTLKPNIYGGLMCRLMNISYIACIAGMGSAINNGGILKGLTLSLLKISLKRASCVFFENKMNLQFFSDNKIEAKQFRLVPGAGVNISYHSYEDYPGDETVKFLFIGRIMKEKGINEYLQVAKTIKCQYPNTEFHIVGYCEEKYEEELKHLQECNIVIYHGLQEEVHSFIKLCHAVILPSYHEGMANVLLEAASSGRPVIASDIPGCQEAFEEGISGYGFKVRNTKALIDTVERFIHLTYENKKKMGLAGRAKVEREFNRPIVVNSYLEEISRIL